jgi:acyl-CoA thioesterase FadM
MISVLINAARRGGLGLLEDSTVPLRVWPTDVDTQGHMNNGRYLSLMDLGRTDLAVRTGLLRLWVSHRWRPLVGGAWVRYRKPLAPLDRYTLHTRLACWDDKWLYYEHRFERHGEVYASAWVKGLVRGRAGNIRPAEMLAALGVFSPSPPLPPAVVTWNEADRLARVEATATAQARGAESDARLPN